jgi:hypothetical protein
MQQFQFHPLQLAKPRKFGISAVMRIKNGGEFLDATIRSHLPYFDEIVACYNNCTDNTETILRQLVLEFPDKIRIFHYEPVVHPILSTEHRRTDTFSIHSMANYYNFALAQCRYQIAVKLDDDHLAIAANMQAAVALVRQEYRLGQRSLLRFSGLNLAGSIAQPLVYRTCPLVGTGDIMFFPIDPQIYFVQARKFETLQFGSLKNKLPKRYLGMLYCHLKHLKADYGFGNLAEPAKSEHIAEYQRSCQLQTLAEFNSSANQQQLITEYGALTYQVRQWPVVKLGLRLLRKQQPLRFARLYQLQQDLATLDWQQDVLRWLQPAATGNLVITDSDINNSACEEPALRRFG